MSLELQEIDILYKGNDLNWFSNDSFSSGTDIILSKSSNG